MNNKVFLMAFRNALYEGFLSDKNALTASRERLRELKTRLDILEPKFLANQVTIDELVAEVRSLLEQPDPDMAVMWNPGRDFCIAASMAVGAAILAAWVASGGTLVVGTVVAGVTISSPIIAALVGGAAAGTIACIAGSCGDC